MLYGLQEQVRQLVDNLSRGRHTLVFGPQGTGKSSLLQEAAKGLKAANPQDRLVIYVEDCRGNRTILNRVENSLHASGVEKRIPAVRGDNSYGGLRIQDMRNHLNKVAGIKKTCLLLDHLPKLRHPMKHLFELLEPNMTLAFAVTAERYEYDLFFWKYEKIELHNLSRQTTSQWVEKELADIGYCQYLQKALARELFRLTKGNPSLCSKIMEMVWGRSSRIEHPVQLRHMYIDVLSEFTPIVSGE